MQIIDDAGKVWDTLSWAEAVQSHVPASDRAFDILSATAVSVFARQQPTWSHNAGTALEIHEDIATDSRAFRVTTPTGTTRFTVTIQPNAAATPAYTDRLYAQTRALLAMILYGAQGDPTVADRLADTFGIQPWRCSFCPAKFFHWDAAQAHNEAVHPERM